jgi:ABC-type nickel/cobalt efflux system permease component RcnA
VEDILFYNLYDVTNKVETLRCNQNHTLREWKAKKRILLISYSRFSSIFCEKKNQMTKNCQEILLEGLVLRHTQQALRPLVYSNWHTHQAHAYSHTQQAPRPHVYANRHTQHAHTHHAPACSHKQHAPRPPVYAYWHMQKYHFGL